MTAQDASNATHRLFEQYLATQGIDWKPIPVGPDRSADYRVTSATSEITCEVKTLLRRVPRDKSGGCDPSKPIVRKIRKARPQLNGTAAEPGCVILNVQYLSRDGNSLNATLSPACNTRFSALVILAEYALNDRNLAVWRQLAERQLAGEVIQPGESLRLLDSQFDRLPNTSQHQGTVRAIVLENPHARTPFPGDLFRGPFDQRWSANGDLYSPVWIGSALETLYADGVPFHML